MRAWDVILDGTVVDTVHFLRECSAAQVRAALIGHDGFDPRIEVRAQVEAGKCER